MQENTRSYYRTGKITTTKGTVYEFEPKDIVKGSGYISNQCCGSTEIELGTVYSAELGITLFTDIDRYTLEDEKIEIPYHLKLPGCALLCGAGPRWVFLYKQGRKAGTEKIWHHSGDDSAAEAQVCIQLF